MEEVTLEKCHVFICYRQEDGLAAADWLYHHLHGSIVQLERSNETMQLDVYLDRDAPAVDDWQEIWLPKLQVARALLFVCTPSAAKRRDGTDWVYRELDKWIAMRQSGPIVIDATGEAEKYLPPIIQERWPNAQRIVCRPDLWEQLPETDREREAERVIDRILRGIRISEEGYWIEELERLKEMNRSLFRRLIGAMSALVLAVAFAFLSYYFQIRAEREATIALAGQLTATSESLRQQEGPALETSVLLANQAHALRSTVGVPSVDVWRVLNKGIALLPGKVGQPFYPFGPDISASAYVNKDSVLFVRRKTASGNDDQAVLCAYEGGDGGWRHLRRYNTATHGEIVGINVDGRWIVTKRPEGIVIWNTLQGEVVREIPVPTGGSRKSAVGLSPGARWLALAVSDDLRIYDLRTDQQTPWRSFPFDRPTNAVFSPNEHHLAYADRDRLTLYSIERGEILHHARIPAGTDQVAAPMFSPDGMYVAVRLASNQTVQMAPSATPGGVNHKICVWRIPPEAGRASESAVVDWQPYEIIVREGGFGVVFEQSRETPKLAILERSQPVQVLDLFSKVSFTLSAGEHGARSAAFGRQELLTVNRDGTARLWDTKQRSEIWRLTQRRPVIEAHFLKGRGWDGAQILTISLNGEVRLWGRPRASVRLAGGPRRIMKYNLSGDFIFAADSHAYRIDTRTGEKMRIPLNIEITHGCVAGALSPDGRHAAFATKWAPPGQPQTLRLVNLDGDREQIDFPLDHHVEVQDLAVASGGSPVLAETRSGAVIAWTPEAIAGEERLRFFHDNQGSADTHRDNNLVLLDPAGDSYLRVFGGATTTLIRQAASGKILGELQLQNRWRPNPVKPAWRRSDSGAYFSFPADNGNVILVRTRELVAIKIAVPESATLLQVDNDGRLLLNTGDAFVVMNTAGDILFRIAHPSSFRTASIGGNGRLLVVSDHDGSVTVWDFVNGLPLADLAADADVKGAIFGPGSDYLILLYSRSFRMRRWRGEDLVHVASSLIGRPLTQDEWQSHVGDIPMR